MERDVKQSVQGLFASLPVTVSNKWKKSQKEKKKERMKKEREREEVKNEQLRKRRNMKTCPFHFFIF